MKETQENVRYLVISESKRVGSGFQHDRVMIFDEHLEAFVEGLDIILTYMDLQR